MILAFFFNFNIIIDSFKLYQSSPHARLLFLQPHILLSLSTARKPPLHYLKANPSSLSGSFPIAHLPSTVPSFFPLSLPPLVAIMLLSLLHRIYLILSRRVSLAFLLIPSQYLQWNKAKFNCVRSTWTNNASLKVLALTLLLYANCFYNLM